MIYCPQPRFSNLSAARDEIGLIARDNHLLRFARANPLKVAAVPSANAAGTFDSC